MNQTVNMNKLETIVMEELNKAAGYAIFESEAWELLEQRILQRIREEAVVAQLGVVASDA